MEATGKKSVAMEIKAIIDRVTMCGPRGEAWSVNDMGDEGRPDVVVISDGAGAAMGWYDARLALAALETAMASGNLVAVDVDRPEKTREQRDQDVWDALAPADAKVIWRRGEGFRLASRDGSSLKSPQIDTRKYQPPAPV